MTFFSKFFHIVLIRDLKDHALQNISTFQQLMFREASTEQTRVFFVLRSSAQLTQRDLLPRVGRQHEDEQGHG